MLEYEWTGEPGPGKPPLVFLHEGLGSLRQWRDFPMRVANATGCAALVYSRYGYGQSDVLQEPRTPSFMHDEALRSLPELLSSLKIVAPVLVGHSDGASIALRAFETTDLSQRLAKYHRDRERTFRGWNDVWLSPAFRDWNIEDCLAGVRCPVLAIQGEDDEYGTMAQLDAIARGVSGPCLVAD